MDTYIEFEKVYRFILYLQKRYILESEISSSPLFSYKKWFDIPPSSVRHFVEETIKMWNILSVHTFYSNISRWFYHFTEQLGGYKLEKDSAVNPLPQLDKKGKTFKSFHHFRVLQLFGTGWKGKVTTISPKHTE